ncbi:side tail fiber protein [Knoellia sinensis KCTC 19936]|uniref:Side tail fiber protein n=2 Tax=Knoellia TaxID=136099 RepID=A0A0A0J2T6_9MICO|nr:side tail fiber protein [Knoellia sinensis KCTC 19936]
MPEGDRPNLRWYTVRAHHPESSTIDVDIVTHGDSGPGSAWAMNAKAGDRAGYRSGGALYRGHECDGPMLIVADETALPAVAAIIEQHPDFVDRSTIHVEVTDRAALTAYDFGRAAVHVHVRGDVAPGTSVLPALRDAQLGDLAYAWVCGEAGMVTEVRRHLVKSVGLDRRNVLFSGYWKLGQERG